MDRMRKSMAALLCTLLFVGLLPAAASAADIQEGTPAFALNETVVAFAGHEWYVIGNGTSGVSPQSGHLTLLAKDSFGNSAFRMGNDTRDDLSWTYWPIDHWYYEGSYNNPQEYNDSTLMKFLATRADAIPANEAALIRARILDDVGYTPVVSGQKLWPLSLNEYQLMSTIYGDVLPGSSYYFWLRSPRYTGFGDIVVPGGGISGTPITNPYPVVLPALQLNLSSVLFTSDASGASSKSFAAVGSGLVGAAAPTQNFKFTMKDSAQTLLVLATTAQSTQSGANLLFRYADATTGTNQYVSCVLLDELGAVKYYGKLADSSSVGRGNLNVPLSGVSDGIYTLKIFSEQANGDMYTDFASMPIAMKVAVSSGSGTVSGFGGTILPGIGDGREIELQVNATHIQWRYTGESDDDWRDLVALAILAGADGGDGQNGADGREVELRVDGGYIQWRYAGGSWTNLMAVSVAIGPQGEQGPAGSQGPQGAQGPAGAAGTNGSDGRDGLNGKDGGNGADGRDGQNGKDGKDSNGILSIAKTGSEGNVDTYTISFTDGTSATFTVTNGKDGVGVASAAFNESGELVFTLTDGTQINLGQLPGGSVPTMGTVSGEKDGAGAAVPVAAGAASGAVASGLLYWLLPLLKKRLLAKAGIE